MNKKTIFALLLLLISGGCYRVTDTVEPQVSYHLQDKHLQSLKTPFAPLNKSEKEVTWGKEMEIAQAFAGELDFYRAISTFKRALVIMPKDCPRRVEAQYDIVLCYYLGKKYTAAAGYFEKSDLPLTDKSFKPFCDLLIMLYDCYLQTKETGKEERIFELIEKNYPKAAKKLAISSALAKADLPAIENMASEPKDKELLTIVNSYRKEKKSVATAQLLNAALPGAGFLYIGQKRSALTAFLLNATFIAASYELFHHGYIGWGIITVSLETGWYFGGIYGAGEEAKFYNERLYESKMENYMNTKGMFPIFMLRYSF